MTCLVPSLLIYLFVYSLPNPDPSWPKFVYLFVHLLLLYAKFICFLFAQGLTLHSASLSTATSGRTSKGPLKSHDVSSYS